MPNVYILSSDNAKIDYCKANHWEVEAVFNSKPSIMDLANFLELDIETMSDYQIIDLVQLVRNENSDIPSALFESNSMGYQLKEYRLTSLACD